MSAFRKKIKQDEYRVAMLPVGVEELARRGTRCWSNRERASGPDSPTRLPAAGGRDGRHRRGRSSPGRHRCVKVKEPQPAEWPLIRPGQILFTYFHFAADRAADRSDARLGRHVRGLRNAGETTEGGCRCLTPMSEVAGRMSIQEGAKYLERPQMGRGILLGGVPGVAPAHIAILGGGVVGANAAKIAAGFQANVALLDVNMDRLRYLDDIMPPTSTSCSATVTRSASKSAAGRPGDRRRADPRSQGTAARRRGRPAKLMKPGSVIIDVAIDQGGCVATSRPTTHSEPTFIVDDVVHYCVTNMPGAVGRTSTFALCNVTLPWVLKIAGCDNFEEAAENPSIATAANIYRGEATHRAVAETFDLPYRAAFVS